MRKGGALPYTKTDTHQTNYCHSWWSPPPPFRTGGWQSNTINAVFLFTRLGQTELVKIGITSPVILMSSALLNPSYFW